MALFLNQELSAEMRKEGLREYIKETGVIDKITGIFAKLLKSNEMPNNPMDFVIEELGGTVKRDLILELQQELDKAEREVSRLRNILTSMGVKNIDDYHGFVKVKKEVLAFETGVSTQTD